MNRKILFALAACVIFVIIKCGTNPQQDNSDQSAASKKDTATVAATDKGVGRFQNVQLTHPLDTQMVAQGQSIYNAKCFACHKLTNEKLVGPGYKGITDRRTPEWIMNFITNTNVMLDSDLVAQQLMVICVTRMPSQNVTDAEARAMLEFLRKNDGKN